MIESNELKNKKFPEQSKTDRENEDALNAWKQKRQQQSLDKLILRFKTRKRHSLLK